MKATQTERGFVLVWHPVYPPEVVDDRDVESRLIQESSAVGDCDDAISNPGSSFLWLGERHHLNREQVADLIQRMQHWLDTGRLAVDKDAAVSD